LVVVFLPYFSAIALKIAKLTLDRRMMVNALEDLSALPRAANVQFDLSADVREILLRHLSVATLKSTAMLTACVSLFNAFVIAAQMKMSAGVMAALLALMVLGLVLIAWLVPQKVHMFARKILGMNFGTAVVLVFCLYDVLLAALSYWRLQQATH
jgi:hypothetical protein